LDIAKCKEFSTTITFIELELKKGIMLVRNSLGKLFEVENTLKLEPFSKILVRHTEELGDIN
jgi:hypothetical protein